MSRVYNAYLTDEEREYMVESMQNDLQMSRYSVMLDMIDSKLELNRKSAELKVLKESGTYDDLKFLYMEAENEANQQKVGVIQSIVNAIKTVISTISNAIKNFVGKNANNESEVEVDAGAYENSNKIINGWNNVTSALNMPDNDMIKKGKAIGTAILGVIGGLAAVNVGNKIYKKVKYKDVADKCTKIDEIQNAILNFLNNSVLGNLKKGVDSFFGLFKKKDKSEEGNQNNEDKNNGQNQTEQKNDGNADKPDVTSEEEKKNPENFLAQISNFVTKIQETLKGLKVPFLKKKDGNAQGEKKEPEQQNDQGDQSGNNGSGNGNQGDGQQGQAGTTGETTESFIDNLLDFSSDDYMDESVDENEDIFSVLNNIL